MKEYGIIALIVVLVGAGALWATNTRVVQAPTDGVDTANVEAKIGETVTARGVSITPLSVLEDSRCAEGVQCIWEGRVRIKATLVSGAGTISQEFVLGQAITTEADTVTLTDVLPAPKEGQTIAPEDYVFRFTVEKR